MEARVHWGVQASVTLAVYFVVVAAAVDCCEEVVPRPCKDHFVEPAIDGSSAESCWGSYLRLLATLILGLLRS